MDKYLSKLYDKFNYLYRDIDKTCITCKDHDCEGYVWLLAEEVEVLYNRNVPIVEINEDLHFVHSFEEADGRVLIDKPKPPCKLRKGGLCTIYDIRPLVCRMYPVGFANESGSLMLVLHQECQFSRVLSSEEKVSFFNAVVDIIQSVPQGTIRRIVDEYTEVDGISSFPNGPNSFEAIASVECLLGEGGGSCV